MASRTGIIMYVVEFGSSYHIHVCRDKYTVLISHDTLVCVVTRLVPFYVIVVVLCAFFFFLLPRPRGQGVACVRDAFDALDHFVSRGGIILSDNPSIWVWHC